MCLEHSENGPFTRARAVYPRTRPVYTAAVTPMYTAVFTARMHGSSSRVHGHVHGRVHVYTTLIRATRPFKWPCTGRVHDRVQKGKKVHGRVYTTRLCTRAVSIAVGVNTTVYMAVYGPCTRAVCMCTPPVHVCGHDRVREMCICTRPRTRLLTRGTWLRTRSCTRVHSRVYGPCTRALHVHTVYGHVRRLHGRVHGP